MSSEISLLVKMLLPSIAISIAINYLGKSLTPIPTTEIALIAVFLPSISIAIFLWLQSVNSGQ
jgi:hypothetical protein